MPVNTLNKNAPNVMARPDYGLAIKDRYGRIQVGGDLGGNAGFLDQAYDVLPWIGDYRAGERAVDAAQPQLRDNLMGGAQVGIRDPQTLARRPPQFQWVI